MTVVQKDGFVNGLKQERILAAREKMGAVAISVHIKYGIQKFPCLLSDGFGLKILVGIAAVPCVKKISRNNQTVVWMQEFFYNKPGCITAMNISGNKKTLHGSHMNF